MGNQGHTPGEWTIIHDFNVIGPDGRCVAACGGHSNNIRSTEVRDENIANARLIAAAPHMLEALEEIAEGRGRFSQDQLEFATNVIEESKATALAAIAKARGDA